MHQFKRIVYPMITRGLNIYNKCSVRAINQNAVNYPRLINPAIIPIVSKRSINRQNLSYIRSFHISFFRLQLAPFQASSSRLDSEEEAQHSYPTAGTKDFLWSSWNRIDLSLSLQNIQPHWTFDVSPKTFTAFHPRRQSWLAKSLVRDKFFSPSCPATFSNVGEIIVQPGHAYSSLLRFHRGSAIAPGRNGCISRYFIVVSPFRVTVKFLQFFSSFNLY